MSEQMKTVLVTMIGKSCPEGGGKPEEIRLMTTGTLEKQEKGYVLRYEETDGDSDEPQPVTLTLSPGQVTMNRTGDYGATLVFGRGQRFDGCYATPFGSLNMGVFSTRVQWRVEKGEGEVRLKYQLDMQGRFVATHDLTVRFYAQDA